jgi:hypothetical protein
VSDGSDTVQLPAPIYAADIQSILISYNGNPQNNPWDTVRYEWQGSGSFRELVPVSGWVRFEYNSTERSIWFRSLMNATYNVAPPPVGTNVLIEIENDLSENAYVPISMKPYLIQGANPLEPSIITNPAANSVVPQFQGGYRCHIRLLTRARHGHVRIADNKLGFEYRPDMGYYGDDSFSYCLVNSLGQRSDAACVRLRVGTGV